MLTVKYVPELVGRGLDNVISVLRNITGTLASARVRLHLIVCWQASQNTNLKYILKKMDFYLITLSFSVLGLGKSMLENSRPSFTMKSNREYM